MCNLKKHKYVLQLHTEKYTVLHWQPKLYVLINIYSAICLLNYYFFYNLIHFSLLG